MLITINTTHVSSINNYYVSQTTFTLFVGGGGGRLCPSVQSEHRLCKTFHNFKTFQAMKDFILSPPDNIKTDIKLSLLHSYFYIYEVIFITLL